MPGTLAPESVSLAPHQQHRATLVTLSAVMVVGLFFVVGVALPYVLAMTPEQYDGYWTRRWWLLLHITTGIVALLSGPIQLWLGITDQRPHLHRRIGLVYISSVVISSMAAYYLAFNTDNGWVFGAGLAGLATAWLVTTGLAFAAIRRHLYDQHKEWTIRSYVVTTAFVSFRILFLGLQTTGVGTLHEQLATASWFCWAVPLLVTEAILQGRKILEVRTI